MDKFEDTVVNPNITLKNFEVRVRDVKDIPEQSKVASTHTGKKDKNYHKSIFLLVLLTAILAYQISVSF